MIQRRRQVETGEAGAVGDVKGRNTETGTEGDNTL